MVLNSEHAVTPPNCKAHFTIHPRFIIRTYIETVFNGIYFSIIERE